MNGDNGDATLWRAYPVSYTLDKALDRHRPRADAVDLLRLPVAVRQRAPLGHHRGGRIGLSAAGRSRGIISRYSGLPFTVGTTSAINAGGQANSATQILPNVQILGGHDANDPYFNGALSPIRRAACWERTGRDLLIGPGYFQMNASISRTFLFKEGKLKFQLTGEAFNLTNTVVFSNPGGSCCWTTNATPARPTTIASALSPPPNPAPRYSAGGRLSAVLSGPRFSIDSRPVFRQEDRPFCCVRAAPLRRGIGLLG